MPEAFIIKRWDAELNGLTAKWRKAYGVLTPDEKIFVDQIISANAFSSDMWRGRGRRVCNLLNLYLIQREDIKPAKQSAKLEAIKAFEDSCPVEITEECKRLLEDSYG